MNQPTEDRIKKIEERQEDFDKRLTTVEGRQTEPIPATTRIEVASVDVLNQLKALEHGQQEISKKQDEQFTYLKGELESISKSQAEQDKGLVMHSRNIGTLQEEVKDVKTIVNALKADIGTVKTIQNGHSKYFEEHGKRLGKIETTMATKDDIAELKDLILKLLPKSLES